MAILPTPRTSDTNGAGAHGDGGIDLRTAVNMLPTPRATRGGSNTETVGLLPTARATDGTKGGPNQRGSSGDLMLPSAVHRLLPTPMAADAQLCASPSRQNRSGYELSALPVLLPTPTSQAAKHGGAGADRGPGTPDDANLWTVVDRLAKNIDWGPYAAAVHRWELILGRPAPTPTQLSAKGNPQLSPKFVEFMMGLPAGWVTDVPGITRNEALKALGNGVVPQQAAEALRVMASWELVP